MEKPLLLTLVVCAGRNAGLKAPLDICRILEQTGDVENAVFYTEKGNDFPVYLEMMELIRQAVRMERTIIVQYPMQPAEYHIRQKECAVLLEKMDVERTIVFVHDINYIRYQDIEIYQKEKEWLGRFRYFIVHNNRMEQCLRQLVPDCKCIQIELFDYLCRDFYKDGNLVSHENMNLQVIFAGSLSMEKAPFLYQLEADKMHFEMNLYGKWVCKVSNPKIWYGGSTNAEVLPERFTGDLGLIWDGEVNAASDHSPQRQYNRINIPHKFSCYMAAGLPVVAWKDSAIAEMIEKYQVGYLIEDLYEINDLDMSKYGYYKKNAEELSKKIRTGYFTLRMWEKVNNLKKW